MMRLISLIAVLALTACGVDGAPERPTLKSGLSVTGQAEIGVARQGG
jgi:hypothetical protein